MLNLKKNSLIVLLMVAALMLTACTGNKGQASAENSQTSATVASETDGAAAAAVLPIADRAGNPITIPSDIQRIVSMSAATTQLIETFGLLDKVVAIDAHSPDYVEGLTELPQFDMMKPDIEVLAALKPDIVFVSGISNHDGGNPFKGLIEAGICVVIIPSSHSIEGVKEDIQFTSDCLGKSQEGKTLIADMTAEIEQIAAVGAAITDKKTVMFEISTLPQIYSFGKGTFLHEMIEIIGAENVFADQENWIPVNEESVIAANPEVILTNVDYIDDPVEDILLRDGWEHINAVKNKEIFYIDNGMSSLTNQNIVGALKQMAKAVYPEAYAAID
ncbi:MAG TPA: ABC transporter substrate-binding protein [Peptococcaceae bacterium]|nr:ABC transporter substrate-binding protein [Peptococcaceae bacterium]